MIAFLLPCVITDSLYINPIKRYGFDKEIVSKLRYKEKDYGPEIVI